MSNKESWTRKILSTRGALKRAQAVLHQVETSASGSVMMTVFERYPIVAMCSEKRNG